MSLKQKVFAYLQNFATLFVHTKSWDIPTREWQVV